MAVSTTAWICRTCGNRYPPAAVPPSACVICAEERQYVPATGQEWTNLAALAAEGHTATWTELEPGLSELAVRPSLGIGHRGLLVTTPRGGILWDPPGYLDDESVEYVRERGGLLGIARSHPHLCGVQDEWSARFPGPTDAGRPCGCRVGTPAGCSAPTMPSPGGTTAWSSRPVSPWCGRAATSPAAPCCTWPTRRRGAAPSWSVTR
ncbi:hypothetical protein [Naasia aerilata]|uniref:Hydrolase n=1 Tax=Naasia aerilata TaxID=1162966 RepID=A0ABM8GA43_9MICO|nr:hypothetical protein [Naasia aerilata]BDZ45063.1 hypothetical protein GCM10025866_09720 [Naasia aerilata]